MLVARPEFLYTMPSNLDGLLRVFEQRAIRLDSLRCIFSGGEVLEDSIRERTRHLLGVEIRDNYGSTEGFIAWQCPAGSYHINAEHVTVEIVDESGIPVAPGQMGRILITTLENRLMPLIRYEIGDYAIASNDLCTCGRTLPVLGKVIGRGINLFRLPGGRLKSPWPLVGPIKGAARDSSIPDRAGNPRSLHRADTFPIASWNPRYKKRFAAPSAKFWKSRRAFHSIGWMRSRAPPAGNS